jgi:glucosyl-3-phosphoglycerate synthase
MHDINIDSGEVATFRILYCHDRNVLKKGIRQRASSKKPVLVMPLLASEFTHPQNLPVFENILEQLAKVRYLHKIIFGLDCATEKEALQLRDLLAQYQIRDCIIQWNDGPVFADIYAKLNQAGFLFLEPGKGKNMFLSFGLAMALGGETIAIVDADIRTFKRIQLDRLLYPVVVCGHDFSKAFYTRISECRMYGRVKRLLLDPLLLSLKKKFEETEERKMLGLINFLLQFQYQLSGEVAFSADLLKKMRFATNWGAEIFTLIEVYRKASSPAQVQFSERPFDHKHQQVSEHNEKQGLNRMSIDIVTTLMNALIQEEGLEISEDFFRDLTVIYGAMAEKQIKMYSDLSMFNNLSYDRDAEEKLVRNVFRNCILRAGETLTTQSAITERLLRVIHTYPEFKPYVEQGLAETIVNIESRMSREIFEIPQTVTWERVANKLPTIYKDIKKAVKEEDARFAV